MSHLLPAISANIVAINQGIRLLDSLDRALYTRRLAVCFDSAIGGHMRHIIDHYLGFLGGLSRAEIDYEKRERDPHIESDPAHAASRLRAVATQLARIAEENGTGPIRVYSETALDGTTCAGTSALRELEFLLSHTIHHYALVAVMARLLGVEPEPTFGIAPSTLRHEQARASGSPPALVVVTTAPCAR